MKRSAILYCRRAGIVGCLALAGCQTPSSPQRWIGQPAPASALESRPRAGTAATADSPPRAAAVDDSQDEAARGRPRDHSPLSDGDTSFTLPVHWETSVEPTPAGGLPAAAVEEAPRGGPVLTLEELRHLALAGNPTLQQSAALVQQAEGNWLQVGLYPNPRLGYVGEGNNEPFDVQGGFLEQSIVTGHKLELNRAVASCDVQRARWEAQTQHLRVLNDIHIRYVAALGAQRQVAVAEELLAVADEGVRVTQLLFEGQEVSRADVLQASLQRSQTLVTLRNARFEATAAWQRLGHAIGWPHLPQRPLAGNLEDGLTVYDWDAAWGKVVQHSPQLQSARARAAAARAQVRREEAQPIPDLHVAGRIAQQTSTPQFLMYGLQVGVTLPLFDRNRGNITAAAGELCAAQWEVQRLELHLRDRLAESFARYRSAWNEVEISRETILPTAAENLSLVELAYREGELDFLRVLTARRDLFQARIDMVRSLTELRIAGIEIDGMLLTGGLDPVESNPTPSNAAGQTAGPGN